LAKGGLLRLGDDLLSDSDDRRRLSDDRLSPEQVGSQRETTVSHGGVIDEGREAYRLFSEATQDKEAVEQVWSEHPELHERYGTTLVSLRPPHPTMPLRVIASVGLHATSRTLTWTDNLESDRRNGHPLQEWYQRLEPTLRRWIPELESDFVAWPEWYPLPGGPFAARRVDWDILNLMAGPARVLLTPVRAWDLDFRRVTAPSFDYAELFLSVERHERSFDLAPDAVSR